MKKYRKFFVVIILCLCFFVSSKFSNIFASSSNDFNKDFYEFYKSLPKTNIEEYTPCEDLIDTSFEVRDRGTIFQTVDLDNGFSVNSLLNLASSYFPSDHCHIDRFKNLNIPSYDFLKENYNKIYIRLIPLYQNNNIYEIHLYIYFYDSNATFTNRSCAITNSSEFPAGENYAISAPYHHYEFKFIYHLKNNDTKVNKPYASFELFDRTTDASLNGYTALYLNPEYIYKCNFDISSTNNLINFESDNFTIDTFGQKDAEIGDTSSKLKLSYEYNEEYTECKINATLEGGQFTDRIFYSNYMPSIARTRFIVKKSISA